MSIESFINDQMAKREARGRSPAFRAEILREKTEFKNSLDELGKNTFAAGVKIFLDTPTTLFLNSFKAASHKKYGASNYMKDAFILFFGKNGVAHSTIKVAFNAIHFVGQGAKIGVRELFKV